MSRNTAIDARVADPEAWCVFVSDVVHTCQVFLATSPRHPMQDAATWKVELYDHIISHYCELNEVQLDIAGTVTLLDLTVIAWCYSCVSASMDPLSFEGVPPLSNADLLRIQTDMREHIKSWGTTIAATSNVCNRLDQTLRRARRAIIANFSVVEQLDIHEAAHISASTETARYADIDSDNSIEVEGKRDDTNTSALSPYRFVELLGRLVSTTGRDMYWWSRHDIQTEYRPTPGTTSHTWTYISELTGLSSTTTSEKAVAKLFLETRVPIGSMCSALRYTKGGWDNIDTSTMASDELGHETHARYNRMCVQDARSVFRDTTQHSELSPLHEAWITILVGRQFRVYAAHEFVPCYLAWHHHLIRYADHFTSSVHNERVKRPMVVFLMGTWCIQNHTENRLELTPCPGGNVFKKKKPRCLYQHMFTSSVGIVDALYAWNIAIRGAPYNGTTANGVNIIPFLDKAFGPMTSSTRPCRSSHRP